MTDRRALVISVITGFRLAVFAGTGLSIDRFGELKAAGTVIAAYLITWIIGTALLYLYLPYLISPILTLPTTWLSVLTKAP